MTKVTSGANAEAIVAPLAAVKDLCELIRRVPHVNEACVERRDAETQDVGRSKVTDDTARDERLHDPVATPRVRERHVAAALDGSPRTGNREIVSGAARLDELDE
jgi:hypothetical protein